MYKSRTGPVTSQNSVQANNSILEVTNDLGELKTTISIFFWSVPFAASDLSQIAIGARFAVVNLGYQICNALFHLIACEAKRMSIQGRTWLAEVWAELV